MSPFDQLLQPPTGNASDRRRSSLGSLSPTRPSAGFESVPDSSPSLATPASQPSHFFCQSPSTATLASSPGPLPLPKLKKTSSQPNLRLPAQISPHSFPSPRNSSTPDQPPSRVTYPQVDLPPLNITTIPTRHSPLHPHHHQRTLSITSSIASAAAQHQQHLLFLTRQAVHHRASVSTCAMTDDTMWDETDNDIEDAQGGLDGFSMNAGPEREAEEESMDCQAIDDEGSMSSKRAGKQREKSESCGSSAFGEGSNSAGPMTIDSDCSAPARSGASGAFGARMVRKRPVNRANLLPRPKAHLRVAAQLSTEDVSPDLQTEAEVHRRFRSVPVLPPATGSPSSHNPFPLGVIPKTPSSPFDGRRPAGLLPPPNRFPEQVGPDEPLGTGDASIDSSDSAPEDEAFEGMFTHPQSPCTEDGDRMTREIQKWNKFRGAGSSSGARAGTHAPCSPDPSPARLNSFLIGQSGGGSAGGSPCASLARPAKRRFQDPDRFDCSPNSSSFKRRAISPSASNAGSSSCIGSPVLHYLQPSPNTMNQEPSKES